MTYIFIIEEIFKVKGLMFTWFVLKYKYSKNTKGMKLNDKKMILQTKKK